MPTYKVHGTVTIGITMTVEADSPDEAMEKADEEWPGLSDYAGNGESHGKLIGTSEECLSLDAGEDYPEFSEAVIDDEE